MRKNLRDKRQRNDSQNCKVAGGHLFRAHAHLAPGCNCLIQISCLHIRLNGEKKKKNYSLLFCEREPEINPAVFASALPTITPRGSTGGQEHCSVFHLKSSHFVKTADTKSFTAPHFFLAGPTFYLETKKKVKLQERFVLTLANVLSLLVSWEKTKNENKIHV